MSQRSIIEINHDLLHQIAATPNLGKLLQNAFGCGERTGEDADRCLKQLGIRRVVQCHHTDDRKVVIYRKEYPIR